MKETDKAWLAAFIDGEGCVTIQSTQRKKDRHPYICPVVVVTQTKTGMLERAREIVGAGTLYERKRKAPNSNTWTWRIKSQLASDVLREVFPYLILKRTQAILAISLQDHITKSRFGPSSRPATSEAIAYRQFLKTMIHRVNGTLKVPIGRDG